MGDNSPRIAPVSPIARVVVQVLNELLRITGADVYASLGDVMRMLGEGGGFDRVFVARLDGTGHTTLAFEWTARGAPRRSMVRDGSHLKEFPLWRAKWQAGKPVVVNVTADVPAGSAERQVLEEAGVLSTLMLPLVDEGQMTGVFCLDVLVTPRNWHPDEVFLLESVARGLANLLRRARAEEMLNLSRTRLEAAMGTIADAVIELDRAHRFVTLHSSGASSAAKFPGIDALRPGDALDAIMPPGPHQLVCDVLDAALREGRASSYTFRIDDVPGAPWFEVHASRIGHSAAEAAGALLVLRDVSSQMQLTADLQHRERLLDRFFRLSPVAILLIHYESGRILDGNPAFREIYGLPETDISTLAVTDLFGGIPEPPPLRDAIRALRERRRFGPLHGDFRRADGSIIPVRMSGFLFTGTRRCRMVWSTIEDITELRAQTEALEQQRREAQDARQELTMAIEALSDGFAIFDRADRLVVHNQAYLRVMSHVSDLICPGVGYRHLLRMAVERGCYLEAEGREEAFIAEYLAAHERGAMDMEIRLADGRTLWLSEHATPDGGRVCLRRDVSEQRDSERNLDRVIRAAQVATWEIDRRSGMAKVNPTWFAMLGLAPGSLTPSAVMDHWMAALHPDDLPRAAEFDRVLRRNRRDSFEITLRLRHADGHWVWIQSRGQTIAWTESGAPALQVGVNIDVTRIKQAEERLEEVIDGANVGLWEYNRRTGAHRVTGRWAEIMGYPPEAAEHGTLPPWESLVHPDDLAAIHRAEAAAFARGVFEVSHQMRVRHAKGHWLWVLAPGRVRTWDEDGQPETMTGVMMDITRTKSLEFELALERDTLALIMDTSVSGITVLDRKGCIRFANREAETVLGRLLPMIEGASFESVEWGITDLQGNPIPAEQMPAAVVLATRGTVRDFRHRIRRPDGEVRVLSVNAGPLLAPETDLAVVCSITDITARIEAEAALKEALDRAEAANRAKSEFLARMSHEIRTPLNGVLGMAELMDRSTQDSEQRTMLSVIRRSGEHLLSMIDDLLDLSKIESGAMELETLILRPSDIVSRALASFGPLAAAKGVRLTHRPEPSARDWRLGDPRRLLQIVINLLGNALKFTESGEVSLHLHAEGDWVAIAVRDSGIGIDPELIPQIFQDFSQADAGTTRRFGGTGLGLPISRNLARLMGGDLTLTSTPGGGTTAEVLLRLPRAGNALEHEGSATGDTALPVLPPMTVLVAEDNATNRIILRAMLDALGLASVTVEDGERAVATWGPGQFDLVLLDIAMPGIDGLTALRRIVERAQEAGVPRPRSIAITANAMTHQIDEYMAAGFDACLTKPTRLEDLAMAIASVMAVPVVQA